MSPKIESLEQPKIEKEKGTEDPTAFVLAEVEKRYKNMPGIRISKLDGLTVKYDEEYQIIFLWWETK